MYTNFYESKDCDHFFDLQSFCFIIFEKNYKDSKDLEHTGIRHPRTKPKRRKEANQNTTTKTKSAKNNPNKLQPKAKRTNRNSRTNQRPREQTKTKPWI